MTEILQAITIGFIYALIFGIIAYAFDLKWHKKKLEDRKNNFPCCNKDKIEKGRKETNELAKELNKVVDYKK